MSLKISIKFRLVFNNRCYAKDKSFRFKYPPEWHQWNQ